LAAAAAAAAAAGGGACSGEGETKQYFSDIAQHVTEKYFHIFSLFTDSNCKF
jgi:hypothetical protein